MIRALLIFGTRPEAIKMAPVVLEMRRREGLAEAVTCVTAQHRQMLDQVLEVFGIRPDFDLNLMAENQTLSSLTAEVLEGVTDVLKRVKPDIVLVQGDTTTAMAAALAGFYQQVPIGHVEAGLRTGLRYRPFPEEMNRRLISALASFHFAPTRTAAAALVAEGVSDGDIYITGNTVVDALLQAVEFQCEVPLQRIANDGRLILVTAHRRENFGKPLEDICMALAQIVRNNPDVEIVYPVHLNPNVQSMVYRLIGANPRIHLIPPVEYQGFVHLLKRAYLVLTDSGGIQEEAPALGKPVLVLRNETERPEAVEAGTVRVVGTATARIVAETERLLNDPAEYLMMAQATSPYGDGHAAERIVDIILEKCKATTTLLA